MLYLLTFIALSLFFIASGFVRHYIRERGQFNAWYRENQIELEKYVLNSHYWNGE